MIDNQVTELKKTLKDNYSIYAKRKKSCCLLKKGTIPGIYYRNKEYKTFSVYQKTIFDKKVGISYEQIIKNFPSVYSKPMGGGMTGSFEAFCTSINKMLKDKYPEVNITTDSRIKLSKKAGGRGARKKRQKSYR